MIVEVLPAEFIFFVAEFYWLEGLGWFGAGFGFTVHWGSDEAGSWGCVEDGSVPGRREGVLVVGGAEEGCCVGVDALG